VSLKSAWATYKILSQKQSKKKKKKTKQTKKKGSAMAVSSFQSSPENSRGWNSLRWAVHFSDSLV
jgi:hypothetical protein